MAQIKNYSLWSSAVHKICSFKCLSCPCCCPCLNQVAIVNVLGKLWSNTVFGMETAVLDPSNSNIWSLSWPSSEMSGLVHSAPTPGLGRRSIADGEAPQSFLCDCTEYVSLSQPLPICLETKIENKYYTLYEISTQISFAFFQCNILL